MEEKKFKDHYRKQDFNISKISWTGQSIFMNV